jgi:hypothetical protein
MRCLSDVKGDRVLDQQVPRSYFNRQKLSSFGIVLFIGLFVPAMIGASILSIAAADPMIITVALAIWVIGAWVSTQIISP